MAVNEDENKHEHIIKNVDRVVALSAAKSDVQEFGATRSRRRRGARELRRRLSKEFTKKLNYVN